MIDNLADMMQREWNLMNNDTTNRSLHPPSLTRKISDSNNPNNSNNSQHQHAHQHHRSMQSIPMITTTDHSDPSASSVMRVSPAFTNRNNLDTGYDTDGGIRTSGSTSKHHHKTSTGYEHFLSPRLGPKRSLQVSKQLSVVPLQQRASLQNHLTVNSPSSTIKNYDDRDEESASDNDTHRHHIRLSRHIRNPIHANARHGSHSAHSHSPTVSHHDRVLANTLSGRPFRIVFMRHSERANQALGPDWFSKAFRTNTYKAYDQNLPIALPKRRYEQAYEFDTPLTVRGLKVARNTGRAMLNNNLAADVCLSSTALRCIQTSERLLTGMDRRDHIPIRIEPGLFECPHLNHHAVDSFMTKKELIENGYNIKLEYKSLIQKVDVPESLDTYFDRCVTVMRGIIDRYGHHGGTVLIVTHAPGLLALTDAIKGVRPQSETFYRTVATYPPLAIYIAEYDGTKWKHSEQPYSITPSENNILICYNQISYIYIYTFKQKLFNSLYYS